MASYRSRRVPRDKIAKVFKDHEMVKFMENLAIDVLETAPENIAAVEAIANEALSRIALLKMPQAPGLRGANGVQVSRDATGNIVEIDMSFVINAVRAFLPRPPVPAPAPDDLQTVLATRIFSR